MNHKPKKYTIPADFDSIHEQVKLLAIKNKCTIKQLLCDNKIDYQAYYNSKNGGYTDNETMEKLIGMQCANTMIVTIGE